MPDPARPISETEDKWTRRIGCGCLLIVAIVVILIITTLELPAMIGW